MVGGIRVLVVCFHFDPSARIAAEDELAALVVGEDQDGEGDGRKPPGEPGMMATNNRLR